MKRLTWLDRHRLHLLALAAACMALVGSQDVRAGPWEARSAQGLTVRIVQDSFRTRDGYLLTRSYPDGAPDTGYGDQGVTIFSLGPDNEGPATLKLDALGRAWVAGASAGPGDTLAAVVLRFLPNGLTDVSYADNGRSVSAPAGRRARALDLAPQADGSTFVAGFVLDAQGVERAGWWRLNPDGRVDTRFALGGLWVDEQAGSTEVRALASGGDGSVALGLVRGDGASAQVEIWVLAKGSASPQFEGAAAAPNAASLVWAAGKWRWVANGSPRSVNLPASRSALSPDVATSAGAGRPATVTQQTGIEVRTATGQAPAAPGLAASVLVTSVPQTGTARGVAWWWWALGLLGLGFALLARGRFRKRVGK